MLNLSGKRIYLACGPTDMRKSINGLVAIIDGSFKLDPFGSTLFAFCNRSRDRLKILEWDGDGFDDYKCTMIKTSILSMTDRSF